MKKKNKKLLTVISALFIFAIVAFAGYEVATNKVTVSFSNGIHITKTSDSQNKSINTEKARQRADDCLFVGCNGFF